MKILSIKEWELAKLDKSSAIDKAKEWDIPFFLSVLLNVRDLNDKDSADKFLYGYNNFSNPFNLIDMDKLKSRVEKSINNLERICIYGDYDADGVTATALMYTYLKKRGADVMYYIPKRESDGYGLNNQTISKLHNYGVKLIITVDNGISAYKEINYAKSLGIDAVVTDHHRPPDPIPDAEAVVDPYRSDCPSTFKCFSGVGVAFKAIVALEYGNTSQEKLIEEYSDLVTIGSIGDFIELKGETRDLVRKGIKVISKAKRPGIKVLLENIGMYGEELDASNVVFGIVPRINVSGRIDEADRSVKLLTAENEDEACAIFDEINEKNQNRKRTENEISRCIETQLADEPWRKYEKIIIVEGEKWHQGVLGIVASRMVKRYGKPCVLMTFEGENAKGSCRSVEGFSIHEAISACSKYLDRFGGHPMAAGINLKTKNIEPFKKAILNYANSLENIPFPKINLDCKLNPSALSHTMVDQLDKLKPFGSGNPEPIFGIYLLEIKNIKPIGGGNHLKLTLSRNNFDIEALYFGKTSIEFLYKIGETVDIAVTLHHNDFRWSNGISLYISDMRLSGTDSIEALEGRRLYEKFKLDKKLSTEEIEVLTPSRKEIGIIYKYLSSNQNIPHRTDIMLKRINNSSINSSKIYISLDIISELGLAKIDLKSDEFKLTIKEVQKTDLSLSPTLKYLKSLITGVQ